MVPPAVVTDVNIWYGIDFDKITRKQRRAFNENLVSLSKNPCSAVQGVTSVAPGRAAALAALCRLVCCFLDLPTLRRYTEIEFNPPRADLKKVYYTTYLPDTFGRIRMGLIKEMYLSYNGYSKPVGGDSLRISCAYQGVVRDVITVKIVSAADSSGAPETVLIRVEGRLANWLR